MFKKLTLTFPMALLAVAVQLQAQVALNPIVEHFTNTKCSICASKNPSFYSNLGNHPEVTHLSIHPSSPYPTCILNQQNKEDNDARTNFYNIYGGTPRLVLNGNPVSPGTNFGSATLFEPILGLTTAFSIDIQQIKSNGNTITTQVTAKKVAASPINELRLFIGLVEDTVFVNGGNGEDEHYNVLRNALTDPDGAVVTLDAVGTSAVLEFTTTANSIWDFERMYSIAILQDADNQDVVQSGKTTTDSGVIQSADQKLGNLELKVWPNPVRSSIFLETPVAGEQEVKIFSLLGELVYQGRFSQQAVLDASQFGEGIFTVKVANGTLAAVRKVLIVKG